MLGALRTRRAALGVVLALAAPSCVYMSGPCRVELTRAASSSQGDVVCEGRGSVWILAPARTVESMGSVASAAMPGP